MRCLPALLLYHYSGDPMILERMLLIFVVPMASSFWLARGIFMLVVYLRDVKQKRIEQLEAQIEQLEAARRAELQAAHLQRMRMMRSARQIDDMSGERLMHGGTLFAGLARQQRAPPGPGLCRVPPPETSSAPRPGERRSDV